MRIFAGVPWKGGIIQQWGNRKHVFLAFGRYVFGTLGNKANIIVRYYLVPCRLSTDPKIRDLEWLWMAWRTILRYMFTITNGQLTNYLLLIYCRLFITRVTNTWPAEKWGKRSIANNDPQSGRIFGIRGHLRCHKCAVVTARVRFSLS